MAYVQARTQEEERNTRPRRKKLDGVVAPCIIDGNESVSRIGNKPSCHRRTYSGLPITAASSEDASRRTEIDGDDCCKK